MGVRLVGGGYRDADQVGVAGEGEDSPHRWSGVGQYEGSAATACPGVVLGERADPRRAEEFQPGHLEHQVALTGSATTLQHPTQLLDGAEVQLAAHHDSRRFDLGNDDGGEPGLVWIKGSGQFGVISHRPSPSAAETHGYGPGWGWGPRQPLTRPAVVPTNCNVTAHSPRAPESDQDVVIGHSVALAHRC